MSIELKLAYSREVPKGCCVVGKEKPNLTYDPIFMSDSLAGELIVDGIIRRERECGEGVIIVFHSEEELEENAESLERALRDILK